MSSTAEDCLRLKRVETLISGIAASSDVHDDQETGESDFN